MTVISSASQHPQSSSLHRQQQQQRVTLFIRLKGGAEGRDFGTEAKKAKKKFEVICAGHLLNTKKLSVIKIGQKNWISCICICVFLLIIKPRFEYSLIAIYSNGNLNITIQIYCYIL
jgi:hypothetical protein